ncbi:MAG: nuclear transport factor 2 family protein [Bacteroidota bacterium]|nr:nuclear transport factor 2 family protein [Bacteroidota bacterium]MDP4218625.1 nuclear transport factor 2 family protein [Bacteroidota bacterium]MDP4245345.1 nuclear transport factor 2 family protein [Bacteroidota bacterium]MDP4252622.1 nuclear transport factor 2 family protein [Bacteroidota bacterium]MDP4258487.1 nuclear transport factor 2 family protein [Bacteroidota bacterium]
MKQIEGLIERYKQAVFQKDLEAFCSLYDENLRVFDMWQRWSYSGLPAWRDMVQGWFASLGPNRDVVTFDDVQIRAGEDMALMTAFIRFTNVTEKGEELRSLEERITWIFVKKDQAWKIIHQHSSSPIDFGSMKVILQR